jgi:hypothetical protein
MPGTVGNQEKGQHPLLEAITRRLVMAQQAEKTQVGALLNRKVREFV